MRTTIKASQGELLSALMCKIVTREKKEGIELVSWHVYVTTTTATATEWFNAAVYK